MIHVIITSRVPGANEHNTYDRTGTAGRVYRTINTSIVALVSTHYSHLWSLRLDDDRDIWTETTKRGSGTFALDTLHTGTGSTRARSTQAQRVLAPLVKALDGYRETL
jgi:hypothetical protein